MQEKGKFPSQTQPNPRGVHELSSSSKLTSKIEEVKAVITLRSGKEVEQCKDQRMYMWKYGQASECGKYSKTDLKQK